MRGESEKAPAGPSFGALYPRWSMALHMLGFWKADGRLLAPGRAERRAVVNLFFE